jgi:[acyl-carrier-protein] S-malonyltransferase
MSSKQLGFVFPGQGSQKVGMLAEIAGRHSQVKDTFDEASQVLGYNMWAMIQQGPQSDLNLTERTQPLLLTASVALWRLWQALGGAPPSLLAGHSLGEFTALVCAQSLDFADAVSLVRQRGQFMQAAVPVGVGAMAAVIGLDDAVINQVCSESEQGEVVAAVNFNSSGQVVIAGHADAVARASEGCLAAGAKKVMPLPVSAPFHTALMRPAGELLQEALANLTLREPVIPVVHNVHAELASDPVAIKALLVEQIHSPVQWVSCVRAMQQHGVTTMVECGPGKVLSGLNRRIDRSLRSAGLEQSAGFEQALQWARELS